VPDRITFIFVGLALWTALLFAWQFLLERRHRKSAAPLSDSVDEGLDPDSMPMSAFALADFTLHRLVEKGLITAEERTATIDEAAAALSTHEHWVGAANNIRKIFKRPPFSPVAAADPPAAVEGRESE